MLQISLGMYEAALAEIMAFESLLFSQKSDVRLIFFQTALQCITNFYSNYKLPEKGLKILMK